MLRKFLVILLLALLLSAACNSKPAIPATSPLSPVTSPLLIPTSRPTAVPILTTTPTRTPRPPSTATLLPTVAPTSVGIAPPPGLIYSTESGIWRVEADGQSIRFFQRPYGVTFSANGAYALYFDGGPEPDQIWLTDFTTGQRRNLVEGFDRIVCCASRWSGRSDWIVFGSFPRSEGPGPSAGYLSVARVDGKEQQVLDPNILSYGEAAMSPDGQTIAYDRAGTAWLYQLGSEPQPFDPESHGLANILGMASPVWSPNGKLLAWRVSGDFDKTQKLAVGVFDLEKHAARILYPYEHTGPGEGWPGAPTWSGDGQWLAYFVQSDVPPGGLWVVRADGKERRAIETIGVIDWAWNPKGHQLAVSQVEHREVSVWLIDVDTWHSERISLPVDARILDWVISPQ